ncbi:uncharacterized protein BXZ73DRAFT_75973 [Epithele typhae]|uniref:uncharacterized protein n=1 Tax=Epithele typhae TaxID=378194 RepID=UPI002007257A|nr:uncharacterized protein BXZ73DRAFT_75973 [Epithele typhae]KAH9939242.1 hypothetical protein BXZ73DRAFT_75973 [Epithele typhae]
MTLSQGTSLWYPLVTASSPMWTHDPDVAWRCREDTISLPDNVEFWLFAFTSHAARIHSAEIVCFITSLPVHLLASIFLLCCTDGGATGRALALTCRYFHAASYSARFHSVKLTFTRDRHQLQTFLAAFTAAREVAAATRATTPRVRHLFLSSGWRERIPGTQHDSPTHAEFTGHVAELMRLVAPDLHTLALLPAARPWATDVPLPASLGTTPFPSLRALTIAGEDRAPNFAPLAPYWMKEAERAEEVRVQYPALPALRRLRISSGRTTGDLARWAECAPGLARLQISDVHPDAPEQLFAGLRRLLRPDGDTQLVVRNGLGPEAMRWQGPLVWPSLEQVLIRPSLVQPHDSQAHRPMLARLAVTMDGARMHCELLPPRPFSADDREAGIVHEASKAQWFGKERRRSF